MTDQCAVILDEAKMVLRSVRARQERSVIASCQKGAEFALDLGQVRRDRRGEHFEQARVNGDAINHRSCVIVVNHPLGSEMAQNCRHCKGRGGKPVLINVHTCQRVEARQPTIITKKA